MTNFARNLKSHHTMNLKSHHTMRYFTHQSNRIFAAVFVLLTMLCSKAWGESIEIASINFKSWEPQSITAGSTVNDIYFKSNGSITAANGWECGGNASNSQHYIAIPLTGVNGAITVSVTFSDNKKHQMKYYVQTGTSAPSITATPGSLSPSAKDGSNTTIHTFTKSGLNAAHSYAVLYIGRYGSDDKNINSIRVTTPGPTTVCLKPGTNWKQANARFALFYFKSSDNSQNGWLDMDEYECTTPAYKVYEATIPAGYDKCIFCRMNPATTENNFNDGVKWNQTSDLDVPTGDAVFYTVPDATWDGSGNGQWGSTPLGICVSGTWLPFAGETITLTASAPGATHFQWYKGGVAIDGATSAVYTKENCTFDDAGSYTCKAWRVAGQEVTSEVFTVKILRIHFKNGRDGGDYGYVDLVNTDPEHHIAEGMIFLGQEWTYGFFVQDGCGNEYGCNNPESEKMHVGNCTNWTMNANVRCLMWTGNGATYTFIVDYSNITAPIISVIYPPDDQVAGLKIYFDNSVVNWSNLHYRIGTKTNTYKEEIFKVPGTDNLYEYTTKEYLNMNAWHIGNNCGYSGDGFSIFRTKTGDEYAITKSVNYEGGATSHDITVTPKGSGSIGSDEINNNCEFYNHTMTRGMKTQNVSIEAPVNGTITVSYIDPTNAPQSFTSGNRDLAHTCILTITTTPDCGYQNATLTVNGDPFTSGNTYILYGKTTIAATFTEGTHTITYHTDGGTINDAGYATEYTFGVGATLPTDVTKAGGWRFMGWYDNSGLSGSPITEITTTECGNKEYWAKWMTIPIFTWTYDATVQAGGIYDMSVSSTGDAAVTITILEVISGVSSSFTSGNPATGHVTIGAYPSATTFTYQATSPATASYGELTETRTLTINRCETEHQLAYGVGYTDGGSSAHPRYFHETDGVGWLTKSTGSSGCGGSDASWSGESWITKSNKDGVHLLQTYKGNIVKIVYYVMAGGANATISALRMSDSYISGESQGENALTGATIVYNNNPSNTGLTKDAKEVVSVQFAEPLAANTYLYLKFSTSSTLYGAKLYEAAGDLPTSVAFSGPASVEKTYGDANFTQAATQTTAGTQSGGTITYSSSDKTVATVNAATGEVTMLTTGRTVITATLAAYGCFTKATASYELIVKPCDDPECTITITSGRADKCSSEAVTLHATAGDGATFQWYRDGVALPGKTGANLTTTATGVYTVEARKTCLQVSDPITISNLADPAVTALHEYYYIKAGRVSPDIDLFQLTSTTSFDMSRPAPEGCSYVERDGIVYLTGTPSLSLAADDYDLTITVHNDCGSTTASATLHLFSLETTPKPKIAWVADGTKAQELPGTVAAAKSTSHPLYTYLETFFDLTPVNAYCTTDTNKLKDYYSQFDLVLLTDYPDTNVKPDGVSGGKEKSYSNALGCLIDDKPLLTFEAFVADCPFWGISSNPKTPNPKQKDIILQCAAHDIFEGMHMGQTIEVLSEIGGEGMQGFENHETPSGMIIIATILNGASGELVTCCERQVVIPARMMIMGLNYGAMEKVNDNGKTIVKQIIDYLLQTTNVADCSLIFDNGINNVFYDAGSYTGTGYKGDGKWSTMANWAPLYNALPTQNQTVRIEQNCIVDVTDAHCASVRLQKGTKGGITYNPRLTILPTGGLTVLDYVREIHGANFMTTYPITFTDLYIRSDAGGNGALVFRDATADLQATVDYYSSATDALTKNPVWQYMGIPISDRPMAIDQYHLAWMCSWESVGTVSSNWVWVENEDRIVPFKGYCITQSSNKTYTHTGALMRPVTQELPLQYFTSPDGNGFNMFANSWVAPIDITKMTVADFGGAAEPTIFIYNTGSRAEYDAGGAPSTNGTNTYYGQYNAIPVAAAPYLSGALTVIPTMQGFFVQATKSGTLTLDYDRICFNHDTYSTVSTPMRAPKRAAEEGAIVPETMTLDVNSENWGDRVYVLMHEEFSDAFNRGWDGTKQEGDGEAPMLAMIAYDRPLAVAALETADEHYLSFRAGKDTAYTFSFEYEGEPIYLYDQLTGEATLIRTGNTYSFEATNKTPIQRFLLTKNPPRVPMGVEPVGAEQPDTKPEKFIHEGQMFILHHGAVYDALGKRVVIRKEGAQ